MDAKAIDGAMVSSGIPANARAAWRALHELDAVLGSIVRHTSEPLIGQMRLTWWHQALTALDTTPPPAQPVLQTLAAELLPCGVAGSQLAAMIEGWEVLLEQRLDHNALEQFATDRGGRLFAAASVVLTGGDGGDVVGMAGAGWALADLAPRLSDGSESGMARTMADEHFAQAFQTRWPRSLRPLGVQALVARAELDGGAAPGSPALALRLIRHRLTGW
jgi:phytoene synthase